MYMCLKQIDAIDSRFCVGRWDRERERESEREIPQTHIGLCLKLG